MPCRLVSTGVSNDHSVHSNMNPSSDIFEDQLLDQLDWLNDPFGPSSDHSYDQSSDQSNSPPSSICEQEATFFHQPNNQRGNQWAHQSVQTSKYQPNDRPVHQSNFHSNQSANQFHHNQPIHQFSHQQFINPSAFTQPADYAQFVDQSVDVSAFYQPVHQVKNQYHETVYANQLHVQPNHQSFNQSVHHQHHAVIHHPIYHSNDASMIPPINQPTQQYVSAHSIHPSAHPSINSSVNQQPITPHTPSYGNNYHHIHHQEINQPTQHPVKQPMNHSVSETNQPVIRVTQAVAVAAIVSGPSQLIPRSTASSASQAIVIASNQQTSKRPSKHQSIDLSAETSTDQLVDPKRMRHRALDRRRHEREQNILARLTTLINQANLPASSTINVSINQSLKQSIRALPARPDRLTLLDIACDHIENLHASVRQTINQSGSRFVLPVMPHMKQWLIQLYSELIHQSVSQSIDPLINQLINPFTNQSISQTFFETCDWMAFTSETGHHVDVNSLSQPTPQLTDRQSVTWLLILEQLEAEYVKYLEFNQFNSPPSVYKAFFHVNLPYASYGLNEIYPPDSDPHFSTFMSRVWSLFLGETNIVHTRVNCTRDGRRGDNSAYMTLAPTCKFWGKAPRANSFTKGRIIVVAPEPFKPTIEYESQ